MNFSRFIAVFLYLNAISLKNSNYKILVAPLNWGLGHATRCIPIINQLLEWNYQVILGSDGDSLALLKKEYPNLQYIELPSYGTNYKTGNLAFNLMMQMPTMLKAIRQEQKLLSKLIIQQNISGIISDNRFGLYSKTVPTAFMTHQVVIPIKIPVLHQIGNWFNHFFIRKFNEVWVPDYDGTPNLSGSMSHDTPLDFKLRYLGPISRMKPFALEKQYDIVIILSGTEPQRTILEHKILIQLAGLPYKVLLVQGLPKQNQHLKCSPKLEMVSFLTGEELNHKIESADLIISRSGYTTIMDLAVLGKRALFIPTPGQKEQEILARHFHKQGIYLNVEQDEIDFSKNIPEALNFTGMKIDTNEASGMEIVMKAWLQKSNLIFHKVEETLY